VRRYHSIEVAVTIQGLRNWQTNTPQEGKGTAFNFLVGKFLTPYSGSTYGWRRLKNGAMSWV